MEERQDGSQPSTSIAAGAKAADDKIDLFRVPHTRMKELVDWPLSEMAMAIDIRELEPNLQAVYEAMWELKTHEYIENTYIMKRLKARLQKKRVYNELVCNCHEDSRLLDVIHLVEKVYLATTQKARFQYSRQLQCAILKFLQEFVKHMKEEESVFGPLLTENFKKEELKVMNEKVLEQHNLFREKVRSEKSLHKAVKRKQSEDVFQGDDLGFDLDDLRFKKSYCQEVKERLSGSQNDLNPPEEPVSDDEPDDINPFAKPDVTVRQDESIESGGLLIPDEILLTIFVNLNVRDLVSASAVCKRWRDVAFSSVLWKALYPAQWARGIWHFDKTLPLESDIPKVNRIAWSDEEDTGDSDDESAAKKPRKQEAINESKIFQGIIRDLLPKIGTFVSTLILSASQKITNTQIRGMLIQLLNVRNVDLSYTKVSGEALIGLPTAGALLQLEELDLSGCRGVDDKFLENLASCYNFQGHKSHLRKLSLSGCFEITGVGILWLAIHKPALVEVDLSGCMKLSGLSLCYLTEDCPRLDPELLYYCSQIEDGPFSDTFSGCANLECATRVCCRKF